MPRSFFYMNTFNINKGFLAQEVKVVFKVLVL